MLSLYFTKWLFHEGSSAQMLWQQVLGTLHSKYWISDSCIESKLNESMVVEF